jgi:hypothetical protein
LLARERLPTKDLCISSMRPGAYVARRIHFKKHDDSAMMRMLRFNNVATQIHLQLLTRVTLTTLQQLWTIPLQFATKNEKVIARAFV